MTALLLISDIIAAVLAGALAYALRDRGILSLWLDHVQPLGVYLRALPIAIVLLVLIFSSRGLYQNRKRLDPFNELCEAISGINLWALMIMAGSYLVKFDYSRIIVALTWVFTLATVSLGRFVIARAIQNKAIRSGRWITNVLVIGAGRPGKEVREQLEQYRNLGYHFVGFIDDAVRHPEVIGSMDELFELTQRHAIHQIYIADPAVSHERILTLVNDCPIPTVEFKIASNVFSLLSEVTGVRDIEQIPSLDLKKTTPSALYQFTKRFIDIIGALALLLLTLPLWAAMVLLVKRDSQGPAMISQDRVGKDGKRFKLYKFRTMHQDTNLYQEAPNTLADKRITRVGTILRQMSLDELPQLWNVLKGEMSLVGPRPEMPFLVERYSPWQRKRLTVKPGLTGLWQILGRKDIPLSENLEYDFYYINNQSLLLDIVILLKTIPMLVRRKGAF